jgi:aspartyl-tRNA(Asn)/glutamyl-tRNA(Gln) amidotransferase subunit A
MATYLEKSAELYDPETRKQLLVWAKVMMADYIQGRRDLDRMRRMIGSLFNKVDLLALPTMARPSLKVADCRTAFQMEGGHTGEFNIYGLPAISIPCGFTATGFPIGLQISGPRSAK